MYGERGGTIDLPTPKRAATGYLGQFPAPRPSGGWEESARDPKVEPALPALFDDLELGDELDAALDAALPTLEGEGEGPAASAGAPSRPSILGLDLSDLPAPVGPLPRSPLSTAARTLAERRGPASVPAVAVPAVALAVAARGPTTKPLAPADSEPAPLPAPPARGQSGELRKFVPGGAAPPGIADGKPASRPGSPLPRPSVAEGPVSPPPGKRVSAPGIVVPSFRDLAARETLPVPRRASQPGIPLMSKPVHSLFDASDAAPPGPSQRGEPTPVPLPPLPSDESGNQRPTPITAAGSGSAPGAASGSEVSETSVLSGQPAASSVVTVEPRPVRLGYLIAGLALLALLLAVVIGYIAGLWPSPKPPGAGGSKPALSSGSAPESPPPSF